MFKRSASAVALLAACALAGCYASTEPASDVRFDSAKLNARGAASDGPASSYFEYWPTSNSAAKLRTAAMRWPAGGEGPFSKRPTALVDGTAYSFRVCGNDDGEPPVCAQTRTFTTPHAMVDAVKGDWTTAIPGAHSSSGSVNAESGRGTVGYAARQGAEFGPYNYTGRVTCLSVSGNQAVVGSVGQARFDGEVPNPDVPNASFRLTVQDPGPGTVDRVGVDLGPGTTPPSCAGPVSGSDPRIYETLGVYDAR